MCCYMAMHLVDKLKGWQGFIFIKEFTIICKKKKKKALKNTSMILSMILSMG